MTLPATAPTWLTLVALALTVISAGGGIASLLLVRANRRKTSVDADEVYTRIAITLVQPLEQRLARAEADLRAEQQRSAQYRKEADAEIDTLRARVRDAQAEADQAYRSSYRLRTLVQQWHRAIMSPQTTIEWLRELVGPNEPAL